jgi:hypothetical protein
MMQLTPEEAARYRQVPVILDQETGFYVFPVCITLNKMCPESLIPIIL